MPTLFDALRSQRVVEVFQASKRLAGEASDASTPGASALGSRCALVTINTLIHQGYPHPSRSFPAMRGATYHVPQARLGPRVPAAHRSRLSISTLVGMESYLGTAQTGSPHTATRTARSSG